MKRPRLVILLTAALTVAAQERPASVFSNLEKEAALGRQLAEDVNRRTPPLNSTAVQDYVRSLGENLSRHISDATFTFSISVTADNSCRVGREPIALPGGYIFVPAGLFLDAQDEGEFAGMLAHAMQHVAQHHGMRRETRAGSSTIPTIYFGLIAPNCTGAPAIPIAQLARVRGDELDADVLAVQTLASAGFDPNALVRFISRVQNETMPRFNANSPMPDREQRVAAMRSTIDNLPPHESTAPQTAEYTSAREEVRRLIEQPARSRVPPSLYKKKLE